MFLDHAIPTAAPSVKATGPKAISEPFTTHAHIAAMKAKTAQPVKIDGQTLTIGDVVAVARHGAKAAICPSVHAAVEASVDFKESKAHTSVYGVTTGFGGSADTRTGDTAALQLSLLEHQLCGFLPSEPTYEAMLLAAMPIPVIRGAMAVRVNSCVRGHSGVRISVLQGIINFLNNGLVPCVPLRGTISASGDLSPLSYIAGSVCGHPDIKVFDTNNKTIITAPEAIAKYGFETVHLIAKEGLGLVNGTAVSASAAALALYDAECLTTMAQVNTALTVEALVGHVGSFDSFIQQIRPHPGQIQAADNIRNLLAGSKLAVHTEEEVGLEDDEHVLRQDRYALRTAAQWFGPQLECLALARSQIEVELNSTTDNPLIDVEGQKYHHGGNFQALATSKAMDSTRLCLQNVGKLAFAQFTEMVNSDMNRGLPSCLAGAEPSTNYHCKGLDIHAAAYTSELGFLANPVSSHVQSAEMHNQSVYSLSYLSSRYTAEANATLALLLSTQLYGICQAVDLRIMTVKFDEAVRALLFSTLEKHFGTYAGEGLKTLHKTAFSVLLKRLEQTGSWDSEGRFDDAAKHLIGVIVDNFTANNVDTAALAALGAWKAEFAASGRDLYCSLRDAATIDGASTTDAAAFLGRTHGVFRTVREDVGVKVRRGDVANGKSGPSIGASVSKIVEAMRDGRLMTAVGECMA